MTRTTASWIAVANAIAEELRTKERDAYVRKSLDELLEMSGAEREPSDFRSRGLWASNMRGDSEYGTFRKAGLVLSFHPDEKGKAVEYVTFRLDGYQAK